MHSALLNTAEFICAETSINFEINVFDWCVRNCAEPYAANLLHYLIRYENICFWIAIWQLVPKEVGNVLSYGEPNRFSNYAGVRQ